MSQSAYDPEHDKPRLRAVVQDSRLRPHLRRRALDLCTLDALQYGTHMDPSARKVVDWTINTTITAVLDYMRAAGFGLIPIEQIQHGQTAFIPTITPLERDCPPNAYKTPDLDPATADLPPVIPQIPAQPPHEQEKQPDNEQ